MSKETVDAYATKEFFVNMFTKDIALHDCVLDLIDNSLDGANRTLRSQKNGHDQSTPYSTFRVDLKVTAQLFEISDNCGGISIDLAKSNVFCFGRPQAPLESGEHRIGLYGVGLKRALFKLGLQSDPSFFLEARSAA